MSPLDQLKQQLSLSSKRWLITGVAGFIGSNLLEFLLESGQTVVGLDNFTTGSRRNLEDVRRCVGAGRWASFIFIEGDIANPVDCDKACTGVEYVLHQAALGSVPRSIIDPQQTNRSNVDGFLNMLVAARDAKVRRFVYASSSSIYGDHPALPKFEDEIGRPLSPYAVTKYVNELYAQVFSKTYRLDCVGLRYFNVFGRRQSPDGPYAAVIPIWMSNLLQGRPCIVNGDGKTSRDFCYIDNAIQANLLAALVQDLEAVNTVYNVAVGQQTTLLDLYRMIQGLLVPLRPEILDQDPQFGDFRPGDVQHSWADTTRAQTRLGYRPSHTIEQGLGEVVRWYVKNVSQPPRPLEAD